MWEPRRLTTLWASRGCYRVSFTFYRAMVSRWIVKNYSVEIFRARHFTRSWSVSPRPTKYMLILFRSWDSSVGIATCYRLDGRGSVRGRGKRFFFSPQRPDRLWGPPWLPSNGTGGCFQGGKAAGAWRWPPPSGAEAKNGGAIPSRPYM
jgi:hypothetical protein